MDAPTLSQALNDLLAALPGMFPGDQDIPLANIRPNPDNPGPPITEQEIQELADNLKEAGLLNPIRVRPDRDNLIAGGAQPHPQNPRLKTDGRPWELADFNFIILTGENRYRSAERLQWPTIKGSIHNPTPFEAVKMTHLDNATRKRGWWADYQSIEQAIKTEPNLTQERIAGQLKMSIESVNWAIGLLPLLNTESRGLIIRIPNNSNKGKEAISEGAASWLIDLGPGTGLKRGVRKKNLAEGQVTPKLWPYPAIPPETQDLVRRTLAVACEHGMTEAQVKRLVAAVQGGQAPEDYSPSVPRPQAEARDLSVPIPPVKGMGATQAGVNHEGTKGTQKGENQRAGLTQRPTLVQTSQTPKPEIATSQNEPIGSAPRNDDTKSQHPHEVMKHLGHALGQAFHWAWQNPLYLLKALAGWVHREAVKSVQRTFKHLVGKVVKTAVLFLILAVGVFLFFPGSVAQKIAWLRNVQPPRIQLGLNHQGTKGTKETKTDEVEATKNQKTEIATSQNEPIGSAPHNDGIQTKAAHSPSELAQSNRGSQLGASTQAKPLTREDKNAQAALDFAGYFYGVSYMNLMDAIDFFKKTVEAGQYSSFMDRYFPMERLERMNAGKQVLSFKPTQPAKLLASDDSSDEFLVKGVMTTSTDAKGETQVISQNPVAAEIIFNRQSDGGYKVGTVKDLSPSEAQALLNAASGSARVANPPSESAPPNPMDPLAKDIGDMAGEAVKKALGPKF